MTAAVYDLVGESPAHRFSPFCWRAKMALKHKGVQFTLRDWHFTDKDAIAFSGQGKVPVLVDADNVVSDSWDIACYLEKAYPDAPSLFPGGAAARQLSLFFKLWCEKELHPLLLRGVLKDLFERVSRTDREYFRRTREERFGCRLEEAGLAPDLVRKKLHSRLLPVREMLEQGSFLVGSGPAFADYVLFGAFQWARVVSPVDFLEQEPRIREWFEEMLKLFDGYAALVPAAQ